MMIQFLILNVGFDSVTVYGVWLIPVKNLNGVALDIYLI